MFIRLFYFPFLFSCYCCLVDSFVDCIVSGHCHKSFFTLFYKVFKTPNRGINAFFHAVESSFPFFLDTYNLVISSLRCLAYASSRVSLFSGPFVVVLPAINLRMVPIILRRKQKWCLSLWRDFYNIVWFRVVFSFYKGILFWIVYFIPASLMVSASNIPSICKFPFLWIFWFSSWFGSSIPFVVFLFSLLEWYIFLWLILFLYSRRIYTQPSRNSTAYIGTSRRRHWPPCQCTQNGIYVL